MNQDIINARVTFRNCPIHVLEKFSFWDVDNAYSQFKEHSGLDECVIVQTCNRIELFGAGKNFNIEKIKKNMGLSCGSRRKCLQGKSKIKQE